MQQAAQSMMQSTSTAFDAQVDFMILRISRVIGRRSRGGGWGARLTPLITYCNRGNAPGRKGSPWPAVIWKNRTAERYDLIVP